MEGYIAWRCSLRKCVIHGMRLCRLRLTGLLIIIMLWFTRLKAFVKSTTEVGSKGVACPVSCDG